MLDIKNDFKNLKFPVVFTDAENSEEKEPEL